MDRYFSEPNQLKSFSKEESAFAVDYTNQTGSLRGVEILNTPPTDINYFRLENRGKIEFWGVNFEKCSFLFEKKEENCECMFVAKQAKNLKMACLIELKYCFDKERNLIANTTKAKSQLTNSLRILLEKGILNTRDYKIYLNISIPDSEKIPFTNFFMTTPDSTCRAKDEGYTLWGYNKLRILNASFLVAEKERI